MGLTRNRGKKIVQYPVFLECINYITDDYWIDLYNDFAVGKFPKGIYVSNNTLCIGSKWKNGGYNFSDKDPETIANEVHDFIIQNTAIYSAEDINKRKDERKEERKEIEKFNQIKKKNEKEMLIVNYILKMKNKLKLTWIETKELFNAIKVGFITKQITSNDVNIKIKNNMIEIKNISGIELQIDEEGKNKWVLLNNIRIKEDVVILDDVYMSSFWNSKYACK
jgi:hypothetical protein